MFHFRVLCAVSHYGRGWSDLIGFLVFFLFSFQDGRSFVRSGHIHEHIHRCGRDGCYGGNETVLPRNYLKSAFGVTYA